MIKGLTLLLAVLLAGCSRSPDTTFYLLNPVPPQTHPVKRVPMRLALSTLTLPAFADKPQMVIQKTRQEVSVEEYHQWAQPLARNVRTVLLTNLGTLLPATVIEPAPWSPPFKPDNYLEVNIPVIAMSLTPNSRLRASWVLYRGDTVFRKREVEYVTPAAGEDYDSLVAAMNANLTRLSMDIARSIAAMPVESSQKSDKIGA